MPNYVESFTPPANPTTRTSPTVVDADGPLSPPTITVSGLPSFLTATQVGSTFQLTSAGNIVAGKYNISYVIYDGVNTVTSSFLATYDAPPVCAGTIGTGNIITTGLIAQHPFIYYIDPTVFNAQDGDALTYSLVNPALAGGDSIVLSL